MILNILGLLGKEIYSSSVWGRFLSLCFTRQCFWSTKFCSAFLLLAIGQCADLPYIPSSVRFCRPVPPVSSIDLSDYLLGCSSELFARLAGGTPNDSCALYFYFCPLYFLFILDASRCVILYLFIVLAAPCVPLDMAMPMLEAQIDAVTIYLEGWSAPSNQCCQI